ncbi:MAG: carbohydrate ABC transporter permease [Thermomicrobiales bacterium]|nr:MAG: carbohydrate ABC transporter permease [Thermomicrobiales bacterium]
MASVEFEHPNRNRSRLDVVEILSYLGMALVIILILVPIFWMLSGSLKTNAEIMTFPPQWLPTNPQWHNYTDAWNAAPFGRFYVNTIITTLAGTTLELTNACLTAYALAFLRFPAKNLIFILLLAALMIPQQVTIIPNYLTVSDVFGQNWINTYQGIVLPGASVAVGTFLLRQAFMSLPNEVIQAARVDGANHLQLLWQIVIPMAKPVLVTFGLISLVAKWNDYLWPLIVTNQDRMRTLSVGISYLYQPEGITRWGPLLAGTFFVIAPMIVIYIWAQKHIIDGITAGATKS